MLISELHLPLVNNNHNITRQHRGEQRWRLANSPQLLDPPLSRKKTKAYLMCYQMRMLV